MIATICIDHATLPDRFDGRRSDTVAAAVEAALKLI